VGHGRPEDCQVKLVTGEAKRRQGAEPAIALDCGLAALGLLQGFAGFCRELPREFGKTQRDVHHGVSTSFVGFAGKRQKKSTMLATVDAKTQNPENLPKCSRGQQLGAHWGRGKNGAKSTQN
jgi:hypothetical protein